MVEWLRVKSCCGCCDLKVPCIILVSLHLATCLSYFVSVVAFTLFNIDELSAGSIGLLLVCAVLLATGIVFAYWFIQGAISGDSKKMKYYLILIGIGVVLAFPLAIFYLFVSVVHQFLFYTLCGALQFYIFVCCQSLYKDCIEQSQGRGYNATENTVIKYDNSGAAPPPSYSSCDNVMQNQSAGPANIREVP